jgi:hypothetical protein
LEAFPKAGIINAATNGSIQIAQTRRSPNPEITSKGKIAIF